MFNCSCNRGRNLFSLTRHLEKYIVEKQNFVTKTEAYLHMPFQYEIQAISCLADWWVALFYDNKPLIMKTQAEDFSFKGLGMHTESAI